MSRANPTAAALRNALKQERRRFERASDLQFAERRRREQSALSEQSFPRSLQTGTFFTPHLLPRARKPQTGLVNEFVVLLTSNDAVVTARSLYNPVRQRASHLPVDLSRELRAKVYSLEQAGYQFIGTNKDILVFERQYNQQQRDRRWAWMSAAALMASATALTVALFAGEYICS